MAIINSHCRRSLQIRVCDGCDYGLRCLRDRAAVRPWYLLCLVPPRGADTQHNLCVSLVASVIRTGRETIPFRHSKWLVFWWHVSLLDLNSASLSFFTLLSCFTTPSGSPSALFQVIYISETGARNAFILPQLGTFCCKSRHATTPLPFVSVVSDFGRGFLRLWLLETSGVDSRF